MSTTLDLKNAITTVIKGKFVDFELINGKTSVYYSIDSESNYKDYFDIIINCAGDISNPKNFTYHYQPRQNISLLENWNILSFNVDPLFEYLFDNFEVIWDKIILIHLLIRFQLKSLDFCYQRMEN